MELEHHIARCLRQNAEFAVNEIIQLFCTMELWDCGGFWQLDSESSPQLRQFDVISSQGIEASARFLSVRSDAFSAANSPLHQVYQSRESMWINAPVNSEAAANEGSSIPFATTLLFPIVSKGNVLGVFDFVSATSREQDKALLDTVMGISAHISLVLQSKEAEQILRESEERFRSLVKLSSDWYWRQNAQHQLTEIAGRHSENFDSVIGSSLWTNPLLCEFLSTTREEQIATLDAHRSFRDLIVRMKTLDGFHDLYFSVSGEPVFDESGAFQGYRGVAQDITVRKQDEERIRYLANHDGLTGLPNRSRFGSTLSAALTAAERYTHKCAVLFIDLDRFKNINDTLGHEAGDALLAIDDFGVGYSSLAQIKRFPIDTLKVDRAFIRDLPHNAEDRAITQAVIAMGRTLSLTVIAEGVETQEQEDFLRDNACDETQGFYFSKPISPEDFLTLHKSHTLLQSNSIEKTV